MDRPFLDANVLFSAAYRANAGLLQFWKRKNVALCSSHYALEEARSNLTQDVQRRRLEKLATVIEFFDPIPRSLPREVILPDKDVPIFQAAMAARATHISLQVTFATLGGISTRKSKASLSCHRPTT